ncbi:MAG: hypothetical protein R3Y28_02185 [Candidatus Gastranaerophilales bacterium]
MAKIIKHTIFNKNKIKELKTKVDGNLCSSLSKDKDESYLYIENNLVIGMISVLPIYGNPSKLSITQLIFNQSDYEVGRQLVEFVIAKFGAMGVTSFHVTVEQSHEELINLFLNQCQFRQCSFENLWKLDDLKPKTQYELPFRYFQNNDSEAVAELYNAELKNLFKPSLERIANEYKEPVFSGLTNIYKNRYVLEEASKNRIVAYASITTNDNCNFIIDLSVNDGYQLDYDEILNFTISEISRRKKSFYAFLKHRQYTKNADKFEEYLHENKLQCIQTQCVLVKDFYKPVKDYSNSHLKVFSFGEKNIMAN